MNLIESAQFTIVDAGNKEVGQDWNHDQFNPFAKIYFITEGEGEVTAGSRNLLLRPGQLYLIPSHISLSMRCRERMAHSWVHFIVSLEGGLDLLSLTGRDLELTPKEPERTRWMIERIAALFTKLNAGVVQNGRAMELQGLLRLLLCEFMTPEADGPGNLDAGGMERFRVSLEYIDRHLDAPLTNGELAALHHWHPTYFANRFARAVGTSPRHYILRKRIARSQELLTTSDLSIGEIARAVGFRDPYYFSRAFKLTCGIPPGRYRQSNHPVSRLR